MVMLLYNDRASPHCLSASRTSPTLPMQLGPLVALGEAAGALLRPGRAVIRRSRTWRGPWCGLIYQLCPMVVPSRRREMGLPVLVRPVGIAAALWRL